MGVMREPDKPRLPNGRPVTPQLKPKKQSPLPKSPSRSNTNSPVRLPAQPAKGQGLSESSDSGSSSSSDSDSDSDSNGSSRSWVQHCWFASNCASPETQKAR